MSGAKIVDYDQLFPGRFLKAGEFDGKKVTLTISEIEIEALPQDKGGDKDKGIISFAETKKKLVLNRTNGECFKAMWGRKLADWIGKRVTLFPDTWNGELAVRVYGSPDIRADMDVEIRLPKRKPLQKTLRLTGVAAREPGAEG